MAGIAPEEPKRAKTENVARLMGVESQFHHAAQAVEAHHGEEDGEVVEVGEDLPDHRLQLHAEQTRDSYYRAEGKRRMESSRDSGKHRAPT